MKTEEILPLYIEQKMANPWMGAIEERNDRILDAKRALLRLCPTNRFGENEDCQLIYEVLDECKMQAGAQSGDVAAQIYEALKGREVGPADLWLINSMINKARQ